MISDVRINQCVSFCNPDNYSENRFNRTRIRNFICSLASYIHVHCNSLSVVHSYFYSKCVSEIRTYDTTDQPFSPDGRNIPWKPSTTSGFEPTAMPVGDHYASARAHFWNDLVPVLRINCNKKCLPCINNIGKQPVFIG